MAAGSIAASVQSMIGSVSAGSTFALLQSAGAAGLSTSSQVIIGGIGGIGATMAKKLWGRNNDPQQEEVMEE